MLSSGLVVCLGLVMWFAKCSWKTRLMILSFPLAVDLGVFTFLTLVHWGTFSGVMAATLGALMCSFLISGGRRLWGYIENKKYYRGYFDMYSHLVREKGTNVARTA